MSWTSLFYWLTVAGNVKMVLLGFVIVTGLYSLAAFIAALGALDEPWSQWEKETKKVARIMLVTFIITTIGYILLPSKRDTLLIIAGGGALTFLTTDSSAKKLPSELTHLILSEIQKVAQETKTQLNIVDVKQQMLNDAKQMTTEQLLQRMQIDSNFAQIILGK